MAQGSLWKIWQKDCQNQQIKEIVSHNDHLGGNHVFNLKIKIFIILL